MVFAKKSKTKNLSDRVYSAEVESFTHGNTNTVLVSKDYILPGDRVLIVDDFLATGAALVGLKALCEQAGVTVVGAGIAIEKVFQGGGDKLRAAGLRVESMARIADMSDDGLSFC
jgi:xanthine phosphoribosyltransferase